MTISVVLRAGLQDSANGEIYLRRRFVSTQSLCRAKTLDKMVDRSLDCAETMSGTDMAFGLEIAS